MPLVPVSSDLPALHKEKIGFSIESIIGGGENIPPLRKLQKGTHCIPSSVISSSVEDGSLPESVRTSSSESDTNDMTLDERGNLATPFPHRRNFLINCNRNGADAPVEIIARSGWPRNEVSNHHVAEDNTARSDNSISSTPTHSRMNDTPVEAYYCTENNSTELSYHPPPLGLLGIPLLAYPPGLLNFAALATATSIAQAQQHLRLGIPARWPPQLIPPQVYPWLFARQGGLLPPRLGIGSSLPGFLVPFRKPKRIRTSFSPNQMLKLEHAFEKNHYVVGSERKMLANSLSLSETQVKVWFQNRRTKHKRIQQEEECAHKTGVNRNEELNGDISADSSTRNHSEGPASGDEEEIVMNNGEHSEAESMNE